MSEETTNELIIEPSTNEVQKVDNPVPKFEIPTEAQDFVGEGKKYKSAEDALKSVPHAQQHIETLESELAVVKEELSKRKTTQELLDEIKSGTRQEATPQAEVNQDTLEQLVAQTLERREFAKTAKSNASIVAAKFTEKFGETAQTAYNQIARESGLTVQQLHNLAATSPNAVLRLAGLDAKVATASSSSGTINTQSLKGTPPDALSAKVPRGASTKDLVRAWKAAGEKVKSQ